MPDLIAFYRLWRMLADVAIHVDELRRPHEPGADRAGSLTYLTSYLRDQEGDDRL
ncbi:hypothetical protein Aab01nite_68290 [Paractinoplanes abujensis]|nr:hypothetical protein Aab01nite_68290 [Actinoplanes abujensis]